MGHSTLSLLEDVISHSVTDHSTQIDLIQATSSRKSLERDSLVDQERGSHFVTIDCSKTEDIVWIDGLGKVVQYSYGSIESL